jgi:hypothetical protein
MSELLPCLEEFWRDYSRRNRTIVAGNDQAVPEDLQRMGWLLLHW